MLPWAHSACSLIHPRPTRLGTSHSGLDPPTSINNPESALQTSHRDPLPRSQMCHGDPRDELLQGHYVSHKDQPEFCSSEDAEIITPASTRHAGPSTASCSTLTMILWQCCVSSPFPGEKTEAQAERKSSVNAGQDLLTNTQKQIFL